MNKSVRYLFALAMGAVALGLCSCSDEDGSDVPSQQDIQTKILGTWKQKIVNGKDCLTNLRSTKTFFADGTEIVSNSKYSESKEEWNWTNKGLYNYTIDGYSVFENSTYSIVTFKTDIQKIDDCEIVYSKTNTTVDFKGDRTSNGVLVKVTADFSQDIIGLWEGVEVTGYETYGDAKHRIEYHTDGTYTYFVEEDGNWVASANVDNEYNVHGDWLATRWRPEVGQDFNYEWWDIDYIRDGVMKWSALREKENGERFTTTFTWKKVE